MSHPLFNSNSCIKLLQEGNTIKVYNEEIPLIKLAKGYRPGYIDRDASSNNDARLIHASHACISIQGRLESFGDKLKRYESNKDNSNISPDLKEFIDAHITSHNCYNQANYWKGKYKACQSKLRDNRDKRNQTRKSNYRNKSGYISIYN